jgi:hypothetical protein
VAVLATDMWSSRLDELSFWHAIAMNLTIIGIHMSLWQICRLKISSWYALVSNHQPTLNESMLFDDKYFKSNKSINIHSQPSFTSKVKSIWPIQPAEIS